LRITKTNPPEDKFCYCCEYWDEVVTNQETQVVAGYCHNDNLKSGVDIDELHWNGLLTFNPKPGMGNFITGAKFGCIHFEQKKVTHKNEMIH